MTPRYSNFPSFQVRFVHATLGVCGPSGAYKSLAAAKGQATRLQKTAGLGYYIVIYVDPGTGVGTTVFATPQRDMYRSTEAFYRGTYENHT